MDNQHKISVIIPTYNRGNMIERAVRSVLNQTYNNIEVIVVDDGSTDNTEEVIKDIKDTSVIYIKEANAGACVARNKGIDVSSGDYIAFLDSDDEWFPEKLEIQYKQQVKYSETVTVIAEYDRENNLLTEEIKTENGDIACLIRQKRVNC